MKLTVENPGELPVRVRLQGDITQSKISPFVEPLGQALGGEPYKKIVVLDMREVDFVDSSGVSWLLSCHKRFREQQGTLVLYNVPPRVQGVLRMLSLHQVLRVAGDEAAALELAGSEGGNG